MHTHFLALKTDVSLADEGLPVPYEFSTLVLVFELHTSYNIATTNHTDEPIWNWGKICFSVEIVLNLAWALCSIGLIGYWWRTRSNNSVPLRMQLFALAMIVLLLLPVISLSDDLASMQGASETDRSVRRILHENHVQILITPAFVASLPEITTSIAFHDWTLERAYIYTPAAATALASRSFTSRPPPQQL